MLKSYLHTLPTLILLLLSHLQIYSLFLLNLFFQQTFGKSDKAGQLPRSVRCSEERLKPTDVYLLDNTISLFLWIGQHVSQEWLQNVFGVQNVGQVDNDNVRVHWILSTPAYPDYMTHHTQDSGLYLRIVSDSWPPSIPCISFWHNWMNWSDVF